VSAGTPIPAPSVLDAVGVGVRIGSTRVLDGIDLSVAPGELVAVLGPNGSGKSTLLAALAGEVTLTEGHVRLLDEDIARTSLPLRSRRRAVLPQRVDVALPFSVEAVVAMGRAPWRGSTTAADDRGLVEEVLRATDLVDLRDRRVTDLSGGEMARVAFARVLAQGCDVLLLDEPTAALDVRHQERLMRLLVCEADRGRAVVVAVHDLDLAASVARRLVLMSDGRVVADGAPQAVLDYTLLSEVFGLPIEVIEDGRGGRIPRPVRRWGPGVAP
jgi:iron complex transport system ATP-binding protein